MNPPYGLLVSLVKFLLTENGCIHVLKEEGAKVSSVYGGSVGLGVEILFGCL